MGRKRCKTAEDWEKCWLRFKNTEEGYMPVRRAAKILNYTPQYIRTLCKKGSLLYAAQQTIDEIVERSSVERYILTRGGTAIKFTKAPALHWDFICRCGQSSIFEAVREKDLAGYIAELVGLVQDIANNGSAMTLQKKYTTPHLCAVITEYSSGQEGGADVWAKVQIARKQDVELTNTGALKPLTAEKKQRKKVYRERDTGGRFK